MPRACVNETGRTRRNCPGVDHRIPTGSRRLLRRANRFMIARCSRRCSAPAAIAPRRNRRRGDIRCREIILRSCNAWPSSRPSSWRCRCPAAAARARHRCRGATVVVIGDSITAVTAWARRGVARAARAADGLARDRRRRQRRPHAGAARGCRAARRARAGAGDHRARRQRHAARRAPAEIVANLEAMVDARAPAARRRC